MIIAMSVYSLEGQAESNIYVIGTSTTVPGSHRGIYDGFGKYVGTKTSRLKTAPITFSVGSVAKDYEIIFTSHLLHYM